MKVLSVDPGFGRCGLAVLEKVGAGKLLHSSCVETAPKAPHAERLLHIARACASLLKTYAPDALAMEKLFFAKNTTTALQVAEARGVILAEAARAGVPVFEYGPGEVKAAVSGFGRADKTQMKRMVKLLLKLEKPIKYDDEYDAIAVGLTHLATRR